MNYIKKPQLPSLREINNCSRLLKDAQTHPQWGAYTFLDTLYTSFEEGKFIAPLWYHDKQHTTEWVAPAAYSIGLEELRKGNITLRDLLLVGIAASFHDTGFSLGESHYDGNEPVGAGFARMYMKNCDYDYSENDMCLVENAIQETNRECRGTSIISEILLDGDLAYMGAQNTLDFLAVEDNLRKEIKARPESKLYKITEEKMENIVNKYQSIFESPTLENQNLFKKGKLEYGLLWEYAWRLVSQGFMQGEYWNRETSRALFQPHKEKNLEIFSSIVKKAEQNFDDKVWSIIPA